MLSHISISNSPTCPVPVNNYMDVYLRVYCECLCPTPFVLLTVPQLKVARSRFYTIKRMSMNHLPDGRHYFSPGTAVSFINS